MSIDRPRADTPLAERSPTTPEEQWIADNVDAEIPRRECVRCGNHVSDDFVRAFGRDDGIVFACPRCTRQGAIFCGAAADPDFEARTSMESNCRNGNRSIEEAQR